MRVPGRKLLVFLFCFLNIESKNYEFKAFYQCEDNEFEEVYQQHTQEVSYVCKNWIQKIQITEAKNTFIRFESKFRERQQEIEEEEQREQEEEQKREKEREIEEKEKRKEERQKRIKQIEERIKKQRQKNTNQPKHTLHTLLRPPLQTQSSLLQSNSQTTNSQPPLQLTKPQSLHFGLQNNPHLPFHVQSLHPQHNQNKEALSMGSHFLNQNVHQPGREKKEAGTIQNLGWKALHQEEFQIPKHNFYDSFSKKDSRFADPSNCIEHNFIRKRHRQDDEDEESEDEDKFKPLKSHRIHNVDDVLFVFEVIQMNKIIFEQSSPNLMGEEETKQQIKIKRNPEDEEETEDETEDHEINLGKDKQKKGDSKEQMSPKLDVNKKDDKVSEKSMKFVRRNE